MSEEDKRDTERHRERERQRQRKRPRETETETETETERQRGRETGQIKLYTRSALHTTETSLVDRDSKCHVTINVCMHTC